MMPFWHFSSLLQIKQVQYLVIVSALPYWTSYSFRLKLWIPFKCILSACGTVKYFSSGQALHVNLHWLYHFPVGEETSACILSLFPKVITFCCNGGIVGWIGTKGGMLSVSLGLLGAGLSSIIDVFAFAFIVRSGIFPDSVLWLSRTLCFISYSLMVISWDFRWPQMDWYVHLMLIPHTKHLYNLNASAAVPYFSLYCSFDIWWTVRIWVQ